MPFVRLPDGRSGYVTQQQYEQMLQTENQTPMQSQQALPLGSLGELVDVGGGVGLSSLFGGSSGTVGIGPVASGSEYAAMLGEGGALGAAAPILGAAGVGLGGYGLYNAIKENDSKSGAMSGAALGGGIAALAPTLGLMTGPVGWGALALGAGLGGLGGYGLTSLFGGGDEYKQEYNRAQALRDKGINWNLNTAEPTKGRSKEELVAEANAAIERGEYGNPTFAQSRLESDLTGKDIWGYSAFGEQFGNDWMGTTEANREAIANKALELGLAREHHGTVDVNFTPELLDYSKGLLEKPIQDPSSSSNNSPQAGPPLTQAPKPKKPKPPPPFLGGGGVPTPAGGPRPYTSPLTYNPMSFKGMLENMRRGSYA